MRSARRVVRSVWKSRREEQQVEVIAGEPGQANEEPVDDVLSTGESVPTAACQDVTAAGRDFGGEPETGSAGCLQHIRIYPDETEQAQYRRYRVVQDGDEPCEKDTYRNNALRLREARAKMRCQRQRQYEYERQHDARPARIARCCLVGDDELPTTMMSVNGVDVAMKIDTEARYSIVGRRYAAMGELLAATTEFTGDIDPRARWQTNRRQWNLDIYCNECLWTGRGHPGFDDRRL